MHTHVDDLKPLAGVSIVNLAVNLPGPLAAARLRDLGASVRKVEPPEGDPLMQACPAWYGALHRDVSVLRLDLKAPAGCAQLAERLLQADLLITSMRPAALDRLGLDWAELHARWPNLCHVAIVGQSAGQADRPGHDLTYQAQLGLVVPPDLPRTLVADVAGAVDAVCAAIGLLFARERTGQSAAVQVSLMDSARGFAAPARYGLTSSGGILGGAWPGYNLYETSDGWIALAALEPRFAQRLADELKLDELTCASLAQAFAGRSAEDWERWAASRDLPLVAVRAPSSPDDVAIGGTRPDAVAK